MNYLARRIYDKHKSKIHVPTQEELVEDNNQKTYEFNNDVVKILNAAGVGFKRTDSKLFKEKK